MESFTERILPRVLILNDKQYNELSKMNSFPSNAVKAQRIPDECFENGEFYRVNTKIADPQKNGLHRCALSHERKEV